MVCIHPINKYQNKSESDFIGLFKVFFEESTVYFNYPYKQEGWLSGIFYNGNYYYLDNKTKDVRKNGRKMNEDILSTLRFLFSKKKGIALDNFSILCEIYPLKCYAKNLDGTLGKIYDERSKFFPFEVTSLNSIVQRDFLEMRRKNENLKSNYENPMKEFPIKSTVILLTKKNFGMLGKVEKYIPNSDLDFDSLSNKNFTEYYDLDTNYDITQQDYLISFKQFYKGLLLEVSVNENYQISPITDSKFTKNLIQNTKEEYITLEKLAKNLNINQITLGIITSNFFVVNSLEKEEFVKLSEMQNWNIGLNMKCKIKNQLMIVPGYTRSTFEEKFDYEQSIIAWEFSDKAVQLIKEYIERFSFIIESIEKYIGLTKSIRFFKIIDLFANVDDIENKLNEIVKWINSTNLIKIPFAPSASHFISFESIDKIKDIVNKKTEELKLKKNLCYSKMYLNPNYALIENTPWTPMFLINPPIQFEVGDRVINTCSSDKKYVPFGLKGTVSAVLEDYIEVLFDKVFFGGTTLNGRIMDKSGMTINPLNLLNLTRYIILNI